MNASYWKVWIDARTVEGAKKVIKHLAELIEMDPQEVEKESSYKSGFVYNFELHHYERFWDSLLLATLRVAQRIGNGWTICGDVDTDPSGVLSTSGKGHVHTSGVSMIQWALFKSRLADL